MPALATVTAYLADEGPAAPARQRGAPRRRRRSTFAERLLAHAPGLRILTTSREALAVPGEAVLQLQSLSCPSVGASSDRGSPTLPVDLEARRPRRRSGCSPSEPTAVDPAFTLDETNVGSVVEICRRLDGIPLAIELAAARVSAMSPDDIALRLGDRFRLLAGGRRTAVPRQQTLHALIDWSWDLLTDDDRRLLRRLSVFTGRLDGADGGADRRRRPRGRWTSWIWSTA